MLEKLAQRSGAGCNLGDKYTQNPTGHKPEQAALVDAPLSRVVGQEDLQTYLPTSAVL